MEIKIKLPTDYLEGETRCGHYVGPEMKRVWAVEIDLLCELIKVCEKHNLKMFAIGGTALGAIRHKGMIPWDDDIDVGMLRKDYTKLQKIAKEEFRHPYFFHDENTAPGSLTGHGRIINSSTTAINRVHLNVKKQGKCTFKQCIFIDIFAFDNVPDNTDERTLFVNDVYEMGLGVWNESKRINRCMTFNEKYTPHTFSEYEKFMAKYSDMPTVWLYTFGVGRRNIERFALMSSEIKNITLKDFEFVKIPIISEYMAELDRLYGNWHEFVKGGHYMEILEILSMILNNLVNTICIVRKI